jgi:hypothetical protein
VFGWAFLLAYLQNKAKQDAGLVGRANVTTGSVSLFWYIPIVNIVGMLAPSLFLGQEVVRALRNQGKDRIWLRRVRLWWLGYLCMLFLPIFGTIILLTAR